jgi:cob(I)alamin adenosyltransferase
MANRLTRITTRGGDQGQSGLADGSRHSKTDAVFAALGDIDELNCALGIVVTHLGSDHPLRATLIALQSRLFDLGGAVAMPGTILSLADEVAALEGQVTQYSQQLGPLANFILPGGTIAGSQMHLARAVSRRAERGLWSLIEQRPDVYDSSLAVFLNRLSDALFVFARVLNLSCPEPLWQQKGRDGIDGD